MKKELTPEERLISFFISEFNNSATNEVSISKSDLPELNLSEQEASRYIYLLKEKDCLKIKHKSVHNDFSMSWHIALEPDCINYFENKKETKKEKILRFFVELRAWITLLISMLAFGLSIYSLYLQNLSNVTK